MRAIIAVVACVALTACAGSPRPSRAVLERIDRVLIGAPGEAQPSRIVATELAYARMSREDGHWDAARAFAAPDAQIHGPDGPVPADAVFRAVREPSLKWDVRNVWMSCDATMAISSGRYVDGKGIVGSYATVWERQPDLDYRWVYDLAMPDDPQPEPEPERTAEENEILVIAAESIQGRVADCLKPGEELPSGPVRLVSVSSKNGTRDSADGTINYMWEHFENGLRRFEFAVIREGEWQYITPFAKEPGVLDK